LPHSAFENIHCLSRAVGIAFKDFCDIEADDEDIRRVGILNDLHELLEDASAYEVGVLYDMAKVLRKRSEEIGESAEND
jgi:hypothetical protein